MTLDDRLSQSLGSAYLSTFGRPPAKLPEPARGHGAALAAGAGAVAVVAAVTVPLVLAHTGSGTTKAPAAGRAAVLETGSPAATGTPACGPGDIKLSAYLNAPSYPESVIEQRDPKLSMTAFVGYGIVTGTGATCRLYNESGSVGFVAPSGEYLGFNGPACGTGDIHHVNRTGAAPAVDPLAAAPCAGAPDQLPTELPTPAAPMTAPVSPSSAPSQGVTIAPSATLRLASLIPLAPVSAAPLPAALQSLNALVTARPPLEAESASPSGAVTVAPAADDDYGVLLGSAGTIDVPADGLGPQSYGRQVNRLHEGKGPTPEPTYRSVPDDYVNDPYLIPANKVEIGTWKMRITFGNQTVDVPFEVTAG